MNGCKKSEKVPRGRFGTRLAGMTILPPRLKRPFLRNAGTLLFFLRRRTISAAENCDAGWTVIPTSLRGFFLRGCRCTTVGCRTVDNNSVTAELPADRCNATTASGSMRRADRTRTRSTSVASSRAPCGWRCAWIMAPELRLPERAGAWRRPTAEVFPIPRVLSTTISNVRPGRSGPSNDRLPRRRSRPRRAGTQLLALDRSRRPRERRGGHRCRPDRSQPEEIVRQHGKAVTGERSGRAFGRGVVLELPRLGCADRRLGRESRRAVSLRESVGAREPGSGFG